ncbi:MAG: DUF3808 domain-containing protein, partial [Bacteroidetes bacterium]|nr:DUF3808 domain-containing protein [Bacteroidota bacterium]
YFDQELSYNPTNSNAYLYKAIACEKNHNNELALTVIEQALQWIPNNALLILEKGHIYFNQNKFKEAIDLYLKALSINSKLEIAYYKLGFCEYHLHHKANACNYWKNIQDIDDFENYETILKTCNLTH